MFVSVTKSGDRYEFVAGESAADDTRAFFRSSKDFYLVAGLKSTYASFPEAHDQAMVFVSSMPSQVQAKRALHYKQADDANDDLDPEAKAMAHYGELVSIVTQRAEGIKSLEGDDRKEAEAKIASEISGVLESMKTIADMAEVEANKKQLAEMIRHMEVLAREHPEPKDDAGQNFMTASAARAAAAIRPTHPDAYLWKISYLPDEDRYEASIAEPSGEGDSEVIWLGFDSSFMLDSVMPSVRLAKSCPYHSVDFLDKYWEPVVRSVGHFSPRGSSFVMVPGMDPGSRSSYAGFDKRNGNPVKVSVSIVGLRSWAFKSRGIGKTASTSKISEGDEVSCVARRLPSYYGRTGDVTAILPGEEYTMYRVDFRQGLGPCWMEGSDLNLTALP